MNGFRWKKEGEEVCAALPCGSVGMLLTNKEGDCTVSLQGMDAQGVFYVWCRAKLRVGDSLTVGLEAVEEADVSEPISVRDARDEEAERRLLLDSYHRLRQELIGEGLLAE